MTDKPDKLHFYLVRLEDGSAKYLNAVEKDQFLKALFRPLGGQMIPREVRQLIQEAPTLVLLQKVMLRIVHNKVAPNTRCQWQNECMLRAIDFVYDSPKDGFWVYNTLFTFLREEQRTRLLELVKRNYARHATTQVQTQQTVTGSG